MFDFLDITVAILEILILLSTAPLRNARMFFHEERVKAIQLFLKYDCSYAATIHELGYPSVGALRKWYKEYLISGELHSRKT